MKTVITLFLMLGLSAPLVANDGNSRVGDFALLDDSGVFHQMSWYGDRKAVVILTRSSQCATNSQVAERFQQLAGKFGPAGFEFMLLNSDGNTDRESVGRQARNAGLAFPVLMDDSQLVSESLNVTHSDEVLVFDPRSFTLVYRGAADATLSARLQGIADGQIATAAATGQSDGSGCDIAYAAGNAHSQSVPSYVNDVAPILIENCVNCHREGGIAPFAMDSHLMVKGWSPMMRETLMTKRMPPGQIDPHIGKFDAFGLTVAEIQTLVHWIDAAAPQDGTVDPLTQLSFNDTRWPLGEPDMIVKVPPMEIPATGTVPYIWVDSGVVLEEGRWLKGSELIPGDASVVHHVISVAVPPDMAGPKIGICPNPCESGDRDPSTDGIRLQGFVPGINPELSGDNTGTWVEAGSRFVFQMHYTTSGKATVDASELGLYFQPEGFTPTEMLVRAAALDNEFVIPPYNSRFPVANSFVVPMDAVLTELSPHMHVRGQSMKFTAQYPDGKRETLLSVPHYDFNWQRTYRFVEPKSLPAGTTIVVEGTFDNSLRNPANPAPEQSVRWGDQSWEEMFIGFLALQVPRP